MMEGEKAISLSYFIQLTRKNCFNCWLHKTKTLKDVSINICSAEAFNFAKLLIWIFWEKFKDDEDIKRINNEIFGWDLSSQMFTHSLDEFQMEKD